MDLLKKSPLSSKLANSSWLAQPGEKRMLFPEGTIFSTVGIAVFKEDPTAIDVIKLIDDEDYN